MINDEERWAARDEGGFAPAQLAHFGLCVCAHELCVCVCVKCADGFLKSRLRNLCCGMSIKDRN